MAPPVRKKSTRKKGSSMSAADRETARRIRGATAGTLAAQKKAAKKAKRKKLFKEIKRFHILAGDKPRSTRTKGLVIAITH